MSKHKRQYSKNNQQVFQRIVFSIFRKRNKMIKNKTQL